MNSTYKINSITATGAHVIIMATQLDDKGAPLPNATLQLLEPKDSKTYEGLKPDDVIKLTLKVAKAG